MRERKGFQPFFCRQPPSLRKLENSDSDKCDPFLLSTLPHYRLHSMDNIVIWLWFWIQWIRKLLYKYKMYIYSHHQSIHWHLLHMPCMYIKKEKFESFCLLCRFPNTLLCRFHTLFTLSILTEVSFLSLSLWYPIVTQGKTWLFLDKMLVG